jgi:hypothetical protein
MEIKYDEADERYQQTYKKEAEEKRFKLENKKSKDLSSEINNEDKSTST